MSSDELMSLLNLVAKEQKLHPHSSEEMDYLQEGL